MISIAMRQNERSAQFIIGGHAEYADKGKDIVCAGVSVLVNALANIARELGEKKVIPLWMVWPDADPFHIYVETGGNEAVNAVMDTFVTEFCQIAGQYPDHVQVQILNERSDDNDVG